MPFFLTSMYWPPQGRFSAAIPFAVATAISVLFAVGAWGWQTHEAQHVSQLRGDAERLKRELVGANASSLDTTAAPTDFAEHLPAAVPIDAIVGQLQRSGAELGVGFVSVAVAERAPTLQTLGRIQLSVMLRGSYSNLKAVLAETFYRHSELVLERLTMRRITAPSDIEARVDLLLLTRPQPASVAAR